MILKLLLLAGVIAAVYFFFIKEKPAGHKTKKTAPGNESDEMVQCCNCGTYSALKETIIKNGRYYCSPECLKA